MHPQLDWTRALAYGARGWGFESLRVLQFRSRSPKNCCVRSWSRLIDTGLAHMLETGSAEPGWMRLVSDATATLGALDARLKSKDAA